MFSDWENGSGSGEAKRTRAREARGKRQIRNGKEEDQRRMELMKVVGCWCVRVVCWVGGRGVVFVGMTVCRHIPRQRDLAVTSLNNVVT
jgi:hypothetical protein